MRQASRCDECGEELAEDELKTPRYFNDRKLCKKCYLKEIM